MQPNRNIKELLLPLSALAGFLLAPILHFFASAPALMLDKKIAEVMASGGYFLSQQTQALLMVATFALHVAVFGGFVLAVAAEKNKHRILCAALSTISCTLWWIWICSQFSQPHANLDLTRVALNYEGETLGLMFASVIGMLGACTIRVAQEILMTRAINLLAGSNCGGSSNPQ